MTQIARVVGMRNAILRNHLKMTVLSQCEYELVELAYSGRLLPLILCKYSFARIGFAKLALIS